MAIDPKQPIPLYFQLKTVLLEEILQAPTAATVSFQPSTSSATATISRTPVSRPSPSSPRRA